MKIKNKILNALFAALIGFAFFACNKKYEGNNSIESVKYNTNKTTYTPMELDSVQAVNRIVAQHLQEVYDLATNYAAGNKDTDIDQTLRNQMMEYFETTDSLQINPLVKTLDSLQARYVKVYDITTFKKPVKKDSLDFATYKLDYYDKSRRYLGMLNKEVQYVLKAPEQDKQFTKEFKFYFVNFNLKKDSIPAKIDQKVSKPVGKIK